MNYYEAGAEAVPHDSAEKAGQQNALTYLIEKPLRRCDAKNIHVSLNVASSSFRFTLQQ